MAPVLRIIARPTVDLGAIERFLEEERTGWRRDAEASPAEALVEFAGRVCYLSFGHRQSQKSNRQYIENLVRQGHESVLEHACWTFLLTRVSRSFSHQFVRHRVGFSYSQLSQQYVEQDEVQFIEPFDLSRHPEAARHWHRAIDAIRDAYRQISELLQEEWPREAFSSKKELSRFIRSAARAILPNATETTLVFTANARSMRHFLRVRGDIEGDLEMRSVAADLLALMQQEAPTLFADFTLDHLPDGSPIVRLRAAPARVGS